MSRTAGARLKFNEGVGVAKELIHKNLGLAPNRLQVAEWKRLDGQRASTKKRRATEAFRQQTIANYKRKAKQRKHELAVSKKRGDEYRAADKKAKTTMTDTTKTTMTNTAKRPQKASPPLPLVIHGPLTQEGRPGRQEAASAPLHRRPRSAKRGTTEEEDDGRW